MTISPFDSVLLLMAAVLIAGIGSAAWSAPTGGAGRPQPPGDADADLQTLRQRLNAALRPQPDREWPRAPSAEQVRRLLAEQRPDGGWPDVDYHDRSRAAWQPIGHLSRLFGMAAAWRTPGHELHGDEQLGQAIVNGYDFWIAAEPQSDNWWFNIIGAPQALYRLMFLLEPDLSAAQLEAGVRILERATLEQTGQNLVWRADITIARGILTGRPDVIAEALQRVEAEARITLGEGIQPDWSFHQHGPQLYSGGYGLPFAMDTARLARLARGTRFAFSEETIEALSGYMLDGLQWMTRGRMLDYSVQGRVIVRSGISAAPLAGACEDMASLQTPRQEEFLAFAQRLRRQAPPEAQAPAGNRHFWRSDFMAHHRPAYYTSVRMSSVRTNATERINGENLKGDRLADGVTYIFRTGEEYFQIFPVWDWLRIPGTTALQKELDWPATFRGLTPFAGGVSDGMFGLAAMDFEKFADDRWDAQPYERQKLTARKAWFFFDEGFAALGAGITCPVEAPVLTSINQCRLIGGVTVAGEGGHGPIERGRHVLANPRWVHHDGVGYVFPQPMQVHLSQLAQSGSWRSINETGSPDEVSMDVFGLWLDHGSMPDGEDYAYIVLPGIDVPELADYARQLPIRIISNTRSLQAVWHDGQKMGQAAFYEPGAAEFPGALTVSVDQACLLMVREERGRLRLATANPQNEAMEVQVRISRKMRGEAVHWLAEAQVSQVTLSLPGGADAGRSVVEEFMLD